MSGRRKLIFGNFKMNFSVKQAVSYAGKLAAKTVPEGVEVAIFPHSLALSEIATMSQKTPIKIGAQNAYFQDQGAFTGEIAMPMLRGIAKYVLVGHSERRRIMGESRDDTRKKMAAAMRSGIKPVLCIGETLTERNYRQTGTVLNEMLTVALADLTSEEVEKIIIAYEPVWAISSGDDFAKHKAALPEDISKVQVLIRRVVAELYGEDAGKKIRILYGGSTNADNSQAFLDVEGIDGLLVGGASLSVQTFWPMVEKAGAKIPKKVIIKKK